MNRYEYIIVGGGMTAASAVKGIRAGDPAGSIAVFSKEEHPPYDRPPLSKGLWKGKQIEEIWRPMEDQIKDLKLNTAIQALNPADKEVVDEDGNVYQYERLLLATGGEPRRLPFEHERLLYYRTFEDYRRLQAWAEEDWTFGVIGGGFIGSEIAAALAMNDRKVEMIFPEIGIGANLFPVDLSRSLNDTYRDHGVRVHDEELVESLERHGDGLLLKLRGGSELSVNAVVAGIGIEPNVELAEAAGLETKDGIRVGRDLRTSDLHIFAAGDVASFFNPALGRHLRVEHEDNANTMGEMAGRAMAGIGVDYDHLPSFYSDLFDDGYEAVGILDPDLDLVADWKTPLEEGVVYYMDDDKLMGVLLWNVWDKVEAARELIASEESMTAEDLKGRLLEA